MNKGTLYALSAYIFWGLHPIYWKALINVPSLEIFANRIFWSFIFFTIILSLRKEWQTLWGTIHSTSNKWILFTPALLIGSNWAMYIWAVNAGYIIETSLGYFICPLVSVFLGVFILHEKLRKMQWIAIGIAALGVISMTLLYRQFPWISLYLAITWATYGLLRKQSPLGPVEGLALETGILSLFSIGYMVFLYNTGTIHFFNNPSTLLLLIGTGIISGLPLLIFITGARLISLSAIGILQYVYPSLIFLIGVFVYHEELNTAKLTGLVFIWIALLIYTIESTIIYHKQKVK